MEFRYGLWRGLSPLYNESGRQLGEANTRPFIFGDHVPAETVTCKYEGTRNGRLINISALRTAMNHFEDALAITAAVRQSMSPPLQILHNAQPGIWDLYIFSRASMAIIAFERRREGQAVNRKPVSDALASQYQFITGIFMVCRDMMQKADPAILRNTPISANDLYAYADEHEIFKSFNGMVCAGSKAKILEFLTFCNEGTESESNDAQVENFKHEPSHNINDHVSAPEKWRTYTAATIEFDCFLEIAYLDKQIDRETEDCEHLQKVRKIYRSLAKYCIEKFDLVPPAAEVTFGEGSLQRQNAILKILGRPQLATIPRKYLKERLDY